MIEWCRIASLVAELECAGPYDSVLAAAAEVSDVCQKLTIGTISDDPINPAGNLALREWRRNRKERAVTLICRINNARPASPDCRARCPILDQGVSVFGQHERSISQGEPSLLADFVVGPEVGKNARKISEDSKGLIMNP